SEAAQVSTFTAAIDCAGGLTGTLTPSEGEAEEVSGTVTAWDPDTGAFQASLTRGGTTYTLTGVLNTNDLTGSFTTSAGTTGNFVVSLSGSPLVCTVDQIASGSAGDEVPAALTSTVATEATTCNGDGAVPYGGEPVASGSVKSASTTENVAVLLKPRTLEDGSKVVDVLLTFAPTDTTPQIAFVGQSADTGSEMRFTAVGTSSGTDYEANLDVSLIINADGSLQGTFEGNVDADGDGDLTGPDDCSALSGTFTGGFQSP
ncbi:MAG: hypothetical protein D6739_00115, partial [Nitrospirae bacterium]